jgi:hypothetical protein
VVRLQGPTVPHRHLVVDVTVTSARRNTNVSKICARLPLPGSLALGAQQGKLDEDLRITSALLSTTSAQSVHDYLLLSLRFGGWAPVGAYGGCVGRSLNNLGSCLALPWHGCSGLSFIAL